MPITLERARADASVRDRLETLAQSIRDKDVDALMTHYAPDIVVFDVMPPLAVRSSADYRQNFEKMVRVDARADRL